MASKRKDINATLYLSTLPCTIGGREIPTTAIHHIRRRSESPQTINGPLALMTIASLFLFLMCISAAAAAAAARAVLSNITLHLKREKYREMNNV